MHENQKTPATKQSEITTATALMCGATLATEVILMMPSSTISKNVNGNVLTRSSLHTAAMNAIGTQLSKTTAA